MIKTVTLGQSNSILKIKHYLTEKNGFSNYDIPIQYNDNKVINMTDLYYINNCDVVLFFGTFGSNHPNRQWQPDTKNLRQAWLETINSFISNYCKSINKKIIVFETGTLCRVRSAITGTTYWKDETPFYYRMGLQHWTYGKATFANPTKDRLKKYLINNPDYKDQLSNQFYNHQWKNNKDGYILICLGLENDPTATKPIDQFVEEAYNEIRKYTDRKIIVKPHPHTKIDFSKYETTYNNLEPGWDKLSLKNLSDKIYCAVLDNSTSVFELTFLGIPCFTNKANFGYKLKNNDLSNIENIYYCTPEEMKEWYNEMAHTEFTLKEIGSDEHLEIIKEMLTYE